MDANHISRRGFLAATAGALATCAPKATAGSPSADPAKKPNFLVLVSDQQHWQAIGAVDSWFDTPNLDALVADGILIENAFYTTPQCSPSRSSLMTGCYHSRTGVMGNIGAAGGDPLKQPTIGGMLQQAGYTTGYFGKWHLGGEPEANTGWDEESKSSLDPETTAQGIDFLRRHSNSDKPFALFLHWLDPHDIYHFKRDKGADDSATAPLPESWHKETFANKPPIHKQFMTEDQGTIIWEDGRPNWEWCRHFYRAKVKLYDDYAGKVIAALKENGLWDNTVIVSTSDHGDMDTHHRLIFKGPFMYEHMVRIPGIFRVPEAFGGANSRRVADFHTVNVDIAPTLLDLAGVEGPSCDGRSLKPLLTGDEMPNRDYVIGQYYSKQKWVNPIRMLRTSEFKYNRYILHGEELYDLRNDPRELVNLADDSSYEKRKKELAAELDRWIKDNDDPFYSLRSTNRQGNVLRG